MSSSHDQKCYYPPVGVAMGVVFLLAIPTGSCFNEHLCESNFTFTEVFITCIMFV